MLAGCSQVFPGSHHAAGDGDDGLPPLRTERLEGRLRDSLNALRQAHGLAPVAVDPALRAAAQRRAQELARRNLLAALFKPDTALKARVRAAGYRGTALGENTADTGDSDMETLVRWMDTEKTRAVLMNPKARTMGFGWEAGQGGKTWWVLITGT